MTDSSSGSHQRLDPRSPAPTGTSVRRRGSFHLKAMLLILSLGVVGVIVAPKYVNAKKAGQKLTVTSCLRTLYAINEYYHHRYRKYADDLEDLPEKASMHTAIASGRRANYGFEYYGGESAWSCSAYPTLDPRNPTYFIDQTGIIRVKKGSQAGSSDPPIE